MVYYYTSCIFVENDYQFCDFATIIKNNIQNQKSRLNINKPYQNTVFIKTKYQNNTNLIFASTTMIRRFITYKIPTNNKYSFDHQLILFFFI